MMTPTIPPPAAIDRLVSAFEVFRAAVNEVEASGGEVEIDVRTVDVSTATESKRMTVLRMEVKAILRAAA